MRQYTPVPGNRLLLTPVYLHLQHMPPPHQCPLKTLLHWTQAYVNPQGLQVFKALKPPVNDPHWAFLNQHYHSQDLLSDSHALEMWVRLCCQWVSLDIADESEALSRSRWQALDPLQHQHHQHIYLQQARRQQAIQKMRARQHHASFD